MLKNYLKIAFRNLQKHKGYSLINILGLAVGIACCTFILLFVQFELSFDSYHKDIDRIFLVALSSQSESGKSLTYGNMPLVAPTLKERFPQVEYASRLNSGWIVQVSYNDKVFKEQGLWHADPDIFQVLDIPIIQGDPETVLNKLNTAVLTQHMANKYFGEKNPIGEVIKIGNKELEITGIVQDSPSNTEYEYKIIMSWKTIEDEEHWQGWLPGMTATDCIIKLNPNVNVNDFDSLISELPHEYAGEELEKKGLTYRFFLFPLKDVHLTSLSGGSFGPSSHLKYVYIFSVTGLLILLIACMNFMNLSTARSSNRSCEVGMRKVVGAFRRQIILNIINCRTHLFIFCIYFFTVI